MKNMYIVYDNKAEMSVGPILLHETEAVAVRAFDQLCDHPETDVHKYPDDFELRELGHFDDKACTIDALTGNRIICNARQRLNRNGTGSRGEQLDLVQ